MIKGSAESVGMNAARLERIGPAMQQSYVDRGIYAGVSTIVARRGIVVHEGNMGSATGKRACRYGRYDLPSLFHDEAHRLHRTDDPIRGGTLRLIDPVARYVPSLAGLKVLQADETLADPKRPVMVRDLMAHTSGLSTTFLRIRRLAVCMPTVS